MHTIFGVLSQLSLIILALVSVLSQLSYEQTIKLTMNYVEIAIKQ